MNQTAKNHASPVVYKIDQEDRIIDFNDNWVSFATDNECNSLGHQAVIGRSLWDFVQDESTATLYKTLFSNIRQSGLKINFPYRCDSPTEKRFMDMELIPFPDQSIEFISKINRIETREKTLYFQYATGANPRAFRCSMCNRFKVKGHWKEVGDAVTEGLVLNHQLPVIVAHGVCPDCMDEVKKFARMEPRTIYQRDYRN